MDIYTPPSPAQEGLAKQYPQPKQRRNQCHGTIPWKQIRFEAKEFWDLQEPTANIHFGVIGGQTHL